MKIKGYYSEQELTELGVKFGENILISNKVSIYCNQLEIGSNVRIDDFCILTGNIKIGSFVHIAAYSLLSGGAGIIVEDFCGIASRTLLFSQSDDYSGAFLTGPWIDERYRNVDSGRIEVRKHSIIGAGSIVMPQVTLEQGTAIGALSFVSKNTEAWSLYYGVPAKKIKQRKKDMMVLEQEFLKRITL